MRTLPGLSAVSRRPANSALQGMPREQDCRRLPARRSRRYQVMIRTWGKTPPRRSTHNTRDQVAVVSAFATIAITAGVFVTQPRRASAIGPPDPCQEVNCDLGPCMDDTCVNGSCVYTFNSDPCDDTIFCNGDDTCSSGSCTVHTGDPCPGADGDDDCSESCDEFAEDCYAPDPVGSACDDGVFLQW